MVLKSSSNFNASAIPVTIFAHLVAVAVITLVLVWLLHFREGLAFKSNIKAKIFNVHPLLMALGFLLVAGEGIMAHKTAPANDKHKKIYHLVLHLIALVCGIIGIYAVFKFHNEMGIPNMYSLHSWFGMSTICLFGLQWLFSFFTFGYPRARSLTRARLAPWHAAFGMLIFLMATLTAEIGLVEKFIFLALRRNQEALIVDFTGLLIFLFAVSVCLTVLLPRGH